MKKIVASVALTCCFVAWSSTVEGSDIDEAWALKEVFQKALQYAESISCDPVARQENVVALVPWRDYELMVDREDAAYALIWYGDVGCNGGTGSVNPYITIVRPGFSGYRFIVDLNRSSPRIKFETTVRDIRVIKATQDELTLSGLKWGRDDPHCCPSIPVQVKLRQDSQGNWKQIEMTQIDR